MAFVHSLTIVHHISPNNFPMPQQQLCNLLSHFVLCCSATTYTNIFISFIRICVTSGNGRNKLNGLLLYHLFPDSHVNIILHRENISNWKRRHRDGNDNRSSSREDRESEMEKEGGGQRRESKIKREKIHRIPATSALAVHRNTAQPYRSS